MLLKFNIYDLFFLSFVQLVLSTILVLSPARTIGARFRWTGSRITELFVGGVEAVAISALACVLTHELWGLPYSGLETGAYLLVVVSVVVMALQPNTNVVGQVFYASYLSASFAFIVYAAFIAVVATHSILEALTASLVIVLDLAAFVVWISNINYVSDVLCRSRRTRPLPKADPSYKPFVSLHIPAYNEPPELLIETIKAVERIDYPNFEVVVIDNNTSDPAVWGPVEEYCRGRKRVRFVHVAPWPGYKAGACNLVLRRYTDPRAEIIGLVDADDIVQSHYLRETAGYFSDPNIGFIQTFEGNREFQGSNYYTACVDSFQAFYLSVMSSRNERDTVPFVGTMGLFRRSALTAVGGWNEWCICEDTEASLRVLKDGWSGLYIPRCFGRGVVPPSFKGMLTQRHRWCFGGMQIMRLHWRSLMPWDRSPGNHLTGAQRRDYLMASVGWFRDLLMLAFSTLLLVITGLLVADSRFAVSPMDGTRSLLPLSLIIIATICMLWTLRLWTTMSFRRALLSLVISLSVTWVVALGCLEGMARRDAVFLRTSKVAGRRRIRTALRLTRVETTLAVVLYTGAGLLATSHHPPWLLVVIIFLQATVYLCGPIASVWNLWAVGVPAPEYLQRFEKRHRRAERRRRSWARLPRPAAVGAALTALCAGGVASAFLAPVPLLHTAVLRHAESPQSLLADSASTQVYLKLGSSTSGAYYFISSVNLSTASARAKLRFSTTSLPLLGEVLRAAAAGGRISHVSVAFRTPGLNGRPTTEFVDTFGTASVASFSEHLSSPPAGTVTLALPALSHVVSAPGALQRVGPFAGLSGPALATKVSVTMGTGAPAYAVTAVRLSQAASGAALDLRFTTPSLPLLDGIFRDQGNAVTIPVLTLTVRSGESGDRFATALTHTFTGLSVGSFAENLSGSLSGTTTLVVPPR
ncbi:MAG TPA: glycosyltransferase [Streptosporangiaceae bacterium]|nr:glycosyltransferase [Streptosporangiaceae bacterium]